MPLACENAIHVMPVNCIVPHPPRAELALPRSVTLIEYRTQGCFRLGDHCGCLVITVSGPKGHFHASLSLADVDLLVYDLSTPGMLWSHQLGASFDVSAQPLHD